MPRFSFKKKDRSQKNSVDFNMPPSPASAGRHKQRRQSHSSSSTSNSSTKKLKPTTPGSNAPKSPPRKSIPKASSSSSKKTSRDNTSTSNGDIHVHVHGHKNAKKKQTPTSIIKSRRYGIQVQASGKGQKKDGDYADDSAYWKAAKQSIVDKRSKKKNGGSKKSSSDSRSEETKLAVEKEASSKRREKKRQEKIAAQRRDKKARLQALKKKHDYSRGLKTPDFPTQKKKKKKIKTNEQDEGNGSDEDSSDDDAAVAKSAFATKSLAARRRKNGAIAFAPSPSEISRGSLIPPTPATERSKIAAESPSLAVAESESYFESPSKSPAKDDDINDGNNGDFEMGQDDNDTLDYEDVADIGGGDVNQMENNDARSSMHEEHVARSAIDSDNIGYVMGKTADIDIDSSRHEDSEAPSESGNNNTAPATRTNGDMAVDDENIESVMGKTADVTLDVNTHVSELNSNNNELGTQDYGAQYNGDESDGFDDGGDENDGPGFELALEHNSDFSDPMASRGEEESSVTSPATKRDEERSRVEDDNPLESPNRSETGSLSESGNPSEEKESLEGADGMGEGEESLMASRAGKQSSIGNGDTEDAVTPSQQQESDSSSSSSPDDRVKESELKRNRAKHLLKEKQLEAASKKQRKKRSRKRVSISTPEITYGTGGGYQVGNRDYTEIPVDSFQNDNSEDGNVRRSRRRRFPPVQFWKNEKIIYEANNATGRMAKIYGDMPMVKGILKAEPTPYKKRKQRPLVHDGDDSDGADVSITAAKNNAKSKSGEEKAFDSTKLRKKYNYEDGESAPIWLEAEGKAGIEKILCYRKKIKLHDLPLVKKRKRGESSIVAKASQTFNVAAQGNMPGFISGCMELPPQAIKDEESVGPCVQIFNVGNCQAKSLELAIADPEENEGNFDAATARRFLLSSGDVFHIPAGNVYRLQNHSKQIECNLSWTIMRPAQDRDA